MPYNVVADCFHAQKRCSRVFKRSAILHGKRPFCFLSPPPFFFGGGGGLAATYGVHLRLRPVLPVHVPVLKCNKTINGVLFLLFCDL